MNEMDAAIRQAQEKRDNRPYLEKLRDYEETLFSVRSGHAFPSTTFSQMLLLAEKRAENPEINSSRKEFDIEQAKTNLENLEIFSGLARAAGIRPPHAPSWYGSVNVDTWHILANSVPGRGMNESREEHFVMTNEGFVLPPAYSRGEGFFSTNGALDGKLLMGSIAQIVVEQGLEWPKSK